LKGSATSLSWRSTRPARGRPREAGGCRPATLTLLPARRIVHKNPTLLRDDANHLLHVDEKEAVAKESGAQLEQLRLIRFRSVADSRDPPEPPRRRLGAEAFAAADISYVLKPKDGTFYAPKIDIYIDDALGREWQMATIQVDLVMLPERFDLTYTDEEGKEQRPMAIHRAIYGSLERFIGILIEHFAGAFPLWLAPVQAVVVPIADRHIDAAEELAGVLRARGLRVEVDDSSNRMQYKIRAAQEQKVPYMVVLGDREIEARTASPRTRAGEQQPAEEWESFADRLAAESRERRVT